MQAILERVARTLAAEKDEEVRGHLQEIEEQGKETLRAVKQRLADMRVELMDPDYQRRKAEKQRQEEVKKQHDMEEAKRFLSEGGLGNLFGGLLGGAHPPAHLQVLRHRPPPCRVPRPRRRRRWSSVVNAETS